MTRGRTAATAATADHAICALWNPSSAYRLTVWEFRYVAASAPGAGSGFYTRRISARGTAGSTQTPVIGNDLEYALAPASGALLDLAAYTGQPTLVTSPGLDGWVMAAVAAAGVILPYPRGIVIPPGTGLAICNNAAIAVPAGDVTFTWSE